MLAKLYNFPLFQYDNLIRILNRGEAMGNDQTGTPWKKQRQRMLNMLFGFRIQSSRSFVQDEDTRICQKGSGNR